MSPEQCGMDRVDERTDLWAIGIMLWELITGAHPLAPVTAERVMLAAAKLDEPMPSITSATADLPDALEHAIDACMIKRKGDRIATAKELLDLVEPLLPGRFGRRLSDDASPYVGLGAFQESDAARFF